jgi:spermidine/putrescine transport system ATP-binding protein
LPDQVDVRLDRVTKRFHDVVAVDDLSLEIVRGEFFSMLGPSGCGKTTTLRMIGGFEEPTAGAVWLGETDVTDLPPFKRHVNTVFQTYALFPHLTVFENIAFGLRRRKVGQDEIRRRVSEMLDLVELPGYEKRRPAQLSGGQQQRVALARALINRPRVLLLDEPLGALDLKLRKQMQLFLKALQHEIGITFVYVTHDQEEAMTMSDRIAVMRNGRIDQVGPPEEVYERPATAFVAGFLGASNLLEGTVGAADGDFRGVELASGEKVRVPADSLNGAAGQIQLGVRPEKIRLETGEAAGGQDNVVRGTVKDATFVGVSNVYTVDTRTGERMTVYAQNLGVSTDRPPVPGDDVALTWHPEHTFVVSGAEGGAESD